MSAPDATIGSVSWWLSVVLVGLILNICSAYLKTFIDRRVFAVSSAIGRKSAERRAIHAEAVARLLGRSNEQIFAAVEVVFYHVIAVLLLTMALIPALGIVVDLIGSKPSVIYRAIGMVLFAVPVLAAFRYMEVARRINKALVEARAAGNASQASEKVSAAT